MRLTKFGSITLPEADGTQSLPIESRVNMVDLQYGGFDLDGNTAVINPTILQHNAIITENIQTNLANLTKELGKGRLLLRAKHIDNTEYQTFGKLQQMNLIPDATRYGCEQAIQIGFTQIYPFWLLSSEEPDCLDDGWVLDDGYTLDSGNKTTISISSPSTSDSTTITNSGGAIIRKGHFVFSVADAGAWEISNLKIKNVTNGLTLTYNSFSGSGNSGEVTINWLSKWCLNETSDLDHSEIQIASSQIDWFRLELGDNVIETSFDVISGTPDLTLDVYHSQHWLY